MLELEPVPDTEVATVAVVEAASVAVAVAAAAAAAMTAKSVGTDMQVAEAVLVPGPEPWSVDAAVA